MHKKNVLLLLLLKTADKLQYSWMEIRKLLTAPIAAKVSALLPKSYIFIYSIPYLCTIRLKSWQRLLYIWFLLDFFYLYRTIWQVPLND